MDIGDEMPEMDIFSYDRLPKSALKEVPGSAMLDIESFHIAGVERTHKARNRLFGILAEEQVHVVRHETVGE